MFAILGLLLAFSISEAANRLIERRDTAVAEANAIRTAYMRINTLPPSVRAEVNLLFAEYVAMRIDASMQLRQGGYAPGILDQTQEVQRRLWNATVAVSEKQSHFFLLGPLNMMFELASTRTVDNQTHTPLMVFALIIVMTISASIIAGRMSATADRRIWVHWIIFAAAITFAIGTLLDLGDPRFGFIHAEEADAPWLDLQNDIREAN